MSRMWSIAPLSPHPSKSSLFLHEHLFRFMHSTEHENQRVQDEFLRVSRLRPEGGVAPAFGDACDASATGIGKFQCLHQ